MNANPTRGRSLGAVLILLIACAPAANAQMANKCVANKGTCVIAKTTGLLRCHRQAEASGVALRPPCVQRVDTMFIRQSDPTKGCFANQERRPNCLTRGDAPALSAKTEAFVSDVVQELDPGFPTAVLNLCSALKKGCASRLARALLHCFVKAEEFGSPLDPACLQKGLDQFTGGANPSHGCFAKQEGRPNCLTTGDSDVIAAKVLAYVDDVACELDPSSPTCPP
jgi:hypothetical protein